MKKTIAMAAVAVAAAGQAAFGGLYEDFRSPQGAVRGNVGPFLWLHQSDGEARLREYVRTIAGSGQGVLTIESRPHDGWMGETWWRDVAAVIDECRKCGIKAMIYDDYWFPSQCFGAMFPIPREFQCRDVKAAVCARAKAPGKVENEIVRVTARETAKNVFTLCPDGDKVIVYSWFVADPKHVTGLPRGRGLPTVNGLDEAAVDWFLEKFYQPYYDRFRDAFRDGTVIGYFFDEPYTKGWWGPALEKELAARGEDVGELLTALRFRLSDPEAQARARYRFLDARAEVWGRTMFGRHSDWCARRGVFSSGHFFEHGETHYDLTFSAGNVMQLLKYVEVPGVDNVCRMWYPSHRADDRRRTASGQIPKYASSVAHVYNRHGGLNWCEMFGAYGQNLTYPEMKWATDTHLAQGCYFMIPHSFNAKAPLDRDCPPYFYNGGYEPRFPLFRVWADYNNRCALLLSGGEHVCHVAQCMPGLSRHAGRIIRPDAFAFALQDVQLDSDFFDYAAVESSCIGRNPRSGRPALKSENGREHYDVLALPAAEYVPFPVLEKALAFAKAGGVVAGYGIKPSNTPTRGKTADDVRRVVAEIFAQPNAVFIDGEPDGGQVQKALSPFIARDFDIVGLSLPDRKMLAANRYEKDGRRILFLANQDFQRGRAFMVRSAWSAESVELWDPMQGTVERPVVENGLVKLALAPSQAVFLVWPDGECSRLEHVDHVDERVFDSTVKETVTPVVVERGPEYARALEVVKPLDGAQWIWHPADRKAKGKVEFRAHIDVAESVTAELVFACSDTATVGVNGRMAAVQTGGAEPYFHGWGDPARATVVLAAGRNEIVVEATQRHNSESKRQRDAGFVAAFTWKGGALRTNAERWEVARPPDGKFVKPCFVAKFGDKPWGRCMLGPTCSPYKESVATTLSFTLPELKEGGRVYFVCDGTEGENSAAVTVNGAYAGGFIGAPYRVDITKSVKPGTNTLEAKPFRLTNPKVVVKQ